MRMASTQRCWRISDSKGQSKHARRVGKITVTVPLKYCLQLSQRKFCQQSMWLTLDLGKEMCKYFSSDISKVSAF